MKDKFTLLVFIFSFILILAYSWHDRILFTDEILFEEAAYQMLKNQDFLIPKQLGEVWLEKPPLYFWLTSLIFKILQPSPFSRRLVTILASLGTIALTFKLARLLFNHKVANWSLIILSTTPLFLYFSKTANLDIPLAFFVTACLFTYQKVKSQPGYIYLSAISLGLAILTRSFIGLVPIPIIILDLLFLSKRKVDNKHFLLAILIAAFIALPWHIYVFTRYRHSFMSQYLSFNIGQHLITPTPGHHNLSLLEFLFNIFIKFNPLAFLIFFSLKTEFPRPLGHGKVQSAEAEKLVIHPKLSVRLWRKSQGFLRRRNKKQITYPTKFLLLWIIIAIVPFIFSATRHEWYIIQTLPALAILSSHGLIKLNNKLKAKVNPLKLEIIYLFALSFLLALPLGVFTSIPKETKSVIMLKQFIANTSSATPLYNLEHQYTPQSTLYNPRETPILSVNLPIFTENNIYLYTDNETQFIQARNLSDECCNLEIFLTYEDAKILELNPK